MPPTRRCPPMSRSLASTTQRTRSFSSSSSPRAIGVGAFLFDRLLTAGVAWQRVVGALAIAALAAGSLGSVRAVLAAATAPSALGAMTGTTSSTSSGGMSNAGSSGAMTGSEAAAMRMITTGAGCTDTPPTPAETAAATSLVSAVTAGMAPYASLDAAETVGYRQSTPWGFGGSGPAHFSDPNLRPADCTDVTDPGNPQSLVYFRFPDGHTALPGAMFTDISGSAPCPGGAMTQWHVH
jgi:hypothetical protein